MIKNRAEAGQRLAQMLLEYTTEPTLSVLGIGTGGMPVAFEIAQTLKAPLDMIRTHKFFVPGHRNLVMGAITSYGSRVSNVEVTRELHIPERVISMVAANEYKVLREAEHRYGGPTAHISVRDRLTIIALDGIESGSCVHAALSQLREERPARIIVATGVVSQMMYHQLAQEVEKVIWLIRQNPPFAVSDWYEEFPEVSELESADLIRQSKEESVRSSVGVLASSPFTRM